MRQLYLGALTAGAYCCLPLHSALAEGSPPSDPVSVFLAVALLVWLFIAIPYVFIRHRRSKKVIGWTLASYPLAFLLGALFMSDEIRPKPKSDTYEVGSDASYREGEDEGLTTEGIYHNMAALECFKTVWDFIVLDPRNGEHQHKERLAEFKKHQEVQTFFAEKAGHVWGDKWTSLISFHAKSIAYHVLDERTGGSVEEFLPRAAGKCAGSVAIDKLLQSKDPFIDGTIRPPKNKGYALVMTENISDFCGRQRSSFKDPLNRSRADIAHKECKRAYDFGMELPLDASTIWNMCINTEPHICYREEVE